MPITWNGQLFQDLKLIIAEWNTGISNVSTGLTNEAAFGTTVLEAAGNLPEHVGMQGQGANVFTSLISGDASIMDSSVTFATGSWVTYAARYLTDNGDIEVSSPTLQQVAQVINSQMVVDDEDVDASAPTAGTVIYDDPNNQGDGTAAIAINSDTTLAELALAGDITLTCVTGGFSVQNLEVWQLSWRGPSTRDGRVVTRTSPTRIVTGTEISDVISSVPEVRDDPRLQVPQRGASIHTGLTITVSTPSYNSATDDAPTTTFANWNVQAKVGTKSNLTRRNTTFAGGGANGNGTMYLRCIDNGGNWDLTWYKEAALDTPLTNTVNFVEGSGDQTISWTAASTNPEVGTPGGFLTTSDTFVQADIDDSAITAEVASFTVTVTFPLPWATGDRIFVPITNAYAGVISRFFVQELGFAIRVINDGSETITDP